MGQREKERNQEVRRDGRRRVRERTYPQDHSVTHAYNTHTHTHGQSTKKEISLSLTSFVCHLNEKSLSLSSFVCHLRWQDLSVLCGWYKNRYISHQVSMPPLCHSIQQIPYALLLQETWKKHPNKRVLSRGALDSRRRVDRKIRIPRFFLCNS